MLQGGKVESGLQLTGSDLGQSRIVIEAGCSQDKGSRKRGGVIESGRRQGSGSDSLQEIACADAESACEQAGGERAEAPPAAGSSGSDGFSEASSDGEAEAENGRESPTVIVSITGESFIQESEVFWLGKVKSSEVPLIFADSEDRQKQLAGSSLWESRESSQKAARLDLESLIANSYAGMSPLDLCSESSSSITQEVLSQTLPAIHIRAFGKGGGEGKSRRRSTIIPDSTTPVVSRRRSTLLQPPTIQDTEADEREVPKAEEAKPAQCQVNNQSLAGSAERVPGPGRLMGGNARPRAQGEKQDGWLGRVRLSASSSYKLTEVRSNTASTRFDLHSTGLDRGFVHGTAPTRAFVSYVGWVPCSGSEMARRPRMMDQCGALARSLGRPCHGIERFEVCKRYTAGRKDRSSSTGLSSARGLNAPVTLDERSRRPAGSDSDIQDRERGNSGIKGYTESLRGRPDVAFYHIVMGLALVLTLGGNELFILFGMDPALEDRLGVLILCTIGVFAIEIVSSLALKPGYSRSFFFILDLVAMISLTPSALQLLNPSFLSFGATPGSTESAMHLARVGRTARSCTRLARLGRISKAITYLSNMGRDNISGAPAPTGRNQQLKIGKKLLDLTSFRVILIVGTMMIMSTVADVVLEEIQSSDVGSGQGTKSKVEMSMLRTLETMLVSSGGDLDAQPFKTTVISYIDGKIKGMDRCPPAEAYGTEISVNAWECPLAYLQIMGVPLWGDGTVLDSSSGHETSGLLALVPGIGAEIQLDTLMDVPSSIAVISSAESDYVEATKGLATVILVGAALGLSSALLGKDIDKLVIAPLEIMSNMVETISADPTVKLSSATLEKHGEGEVQMISRALVKLSGMLQIAFGEAGASIIRNNLKSSAGDKIQPLAPGRRVMGIFGFCDVRQFTVATECLQQDIMVFINCIAEYLHVSVHDNGGAPNKNVGDAWLMAWPLNDGAWTSSAPGMQKIVQEKAESALRSLLRVVLETSCSHVMRQLSSNPALQERIPGFKTELGFGLHVGWAIEGTIGSELKIDPSYLSPHVEISQKLEAGTKHYGVNVLMSDTFYDLLPPKVQRLCRCIDRIKENDNRAVPMDLYTYDFETFSSSEGCMPLITGKPARTFWEQFPPSTSPSLRSNFAMGLKRYFDGDWSVAQVMMQNCLDICPGDRPSQQILDVMAANDFVAPLTWKGYREVTSDSMAIRKIPTRGFSVPRSVTSDTDSFVSRWSESGGSMMFSRNNDSSTPASNFDGGSFNSMTGISTSRRVVKAVGPIKAKSWSNLYPPAGLTGVIEDSEKGTDESTITSPQLRGDRSTLSSHASVSPGRSMVGPARRQPSPASLRQPSPTSMSLRRGIGLPDHIAVGGAGAVVGLTGQGLGPGRVPPDVMRFGAVTTNPSNRRRSLPVDS